MPLYHWVLHLLSTLNIHKACWPDQINVIFLKQTSIVITPLITKLYMSVVLTGKNTSYTGDPINSVYPVHTATLHFNGIPYHDQNKSFTCFITDLNVRFLQQYNVPDDNLTYFMTVYICDSSSSSGDLTNGPIVGIGISSILILAFVLFVIYFCYGKRQQAKRRKLSIQAPFQ